VTFLDGNELAAPLREIFTVDLTVASGQCANCGRRCKLAEARLYARAPELVARCTGCEAVLMRLVRSPDRVWLDLSGLSYLEIARPPD